MSERHERSLDRNVIGAMLSKYMREMKERDITKRTKRKQEISSLVSKIESKLFETKSGLVPLDEIDVSVPDDWSEDV